MFSRRPQRTECVYKRLQSTTNHPSSSSSSPSVAASSSSSSLSVAAAVPGVPNPLMSRLLSNLDGLEGEGRVNGPTFNRKMTETTWKLADDEWQTKKEFEVDEQTMAIFESMGKLNRFRHLSKLCPVIRSTSTNGPITAPGDAPAAPAPPPSVSSGLLESVSLLLWGFESASDLLRRLMFVQFVEIGQKKLFPRWIQQQEKGSDRTQHQELGWTHLVNLLGSGSEAQTIRPLRDSVYIFGLANIIKRPIIVISRRNSSSAEVHLPLLFEAQSCNRHPLALAFDGQSFFPLVEMESERRRGAARGWSIPLGDSNMHSISVRFLVEEERIDELATLKSYLNLQVLPVRENRGRMNILVATAASNDEVRCSEISSSDASTSSGSSKSQPIQSEKRQFVDAATQTTPTGSESNASRQAELGYEECSGDLVSSEDRRITIEGKQCAESGCKFFGQWETDWRCSQCYAQNLRRSSPKKDQLNLHHQDESLLPQKHPRAELQNSNFSKVHFYPDLSDFCPRLNVKGKGEKRQDVVPLWSSPDPDRGCENQVEPWELLELTDHSEIEREFLAEARNREQVIIASALKCRSQSCFHFGSSRCRGLCHSCYARFTRK